MRHYNYNEKHLITAITELIAFFDKFNFPLTSFEVWRFLSLKTDYFEVVKALESLPASVLQAKNGFYFFSGRAKIVDTRMRRYNYANRKTKKAIFFSRLFKFVPWIRMIAVGNIIGPNNMRNEGDIDFFIVTEKSRIWMTRMGCVLIAKLFRARPSANKMKDTICLSFYVTEDNLDLNNVVYGKQDYYFLYWLACLFPIYDMGGVYEKLIDENHWLLSQLPNWAKSESLAKNMLKPRKSLVYRDIIDMLIGGLEPWAKKKQLKIMPEVLARAINHPSKAVVISDQILKLHVNDRREEYNRNL